MPGLFGKITGVVVMPSFVETLESRQLFSGVTLGLAEAQLSVDLSTLGSDARTAKPALIDSAQTFAADVKALNLKNSPLKTKVVNAINVARTKLTTDVTQIINAGEADAKAIVSDVLHITLLDTGNSTKIARDQKKLANNIATLQKVETPLINKLSSDVQAQSAKVDSAVSNFVAANPSDQVIATDWTNLSGVFQTQEQILVPDLNNVISDLGAISTAT
jgi:hypothetical protein